MDPNILRRHLALAEQHAAHGRRHIEKQQALIARMDRKGNDTTDARKLLATLRRSQENHEADIAPLLSELASA
jgi:hypothetical protein